jgi:hypothetical protein
MPCVYAPANFGRESMRRGSGPTRFLAASLVVGLSLAPSAFARPRSTDIRSTRSTTSFARSAVSVGPDSRRSVSGEEYLVHDDLSKALRRGEISEATYALNRALALFHLGQERARFGHVATPNPREATLVLKDLITRYSELSSVQRVVADALLARPTDGASDPFGDGYSVAEATPVCDANGCIHYVTSSSDASTPDWVNSAASAFGTVWSTEISQYGYRPPKSDLTSTNHGPDGKIDVYLADTGADGLYGYCTTDDPNAFDPNYPYFDASAFCVVDNDMSPSQFQGGASGVPALQVTLAHEFFHAAQGAYDWFEDAWFAEGTATWIEDEVFDNVNDNRQYLGSSQLRQPFVPLDFSNTRYLNVYGTWIWFRFLSEYFGNANNPDPSIIKRAWEYADGSASGPDQFSLRAIASAIKDRDWKFRFAYADFGVWNDVPGLTYAEGDNYPVPPYDKKYRITTRHPVLGGRLVMDHLTQGYIGFQPRTGVSPTAKLRVAVDLPSYRAGSEASVVMINSNGGAKYKIVHLNAQGNGAVTVPFGKGKIAVVDLVITNASERTSNCFSDPNFTFSCAGDPRDDRLRYFYAAALVQ